MMEFLCFEQSLLSEYLQVYGDVKQSNIWGIKVVFMSVIVSFQEKWHAISARNRCRKCIWLCQTRDLHGCQGRKVREWKVADMADRSSTQFYLLL